MAPDRGLFPPSSATSGQSPAVSMEWQIHRAKERPLGLALVAGGYAVAIGLWQWLFPHPIALFLPLFAMTSALSDYLFPIRYRLTDEGIHADCGPWQRLHLRWEDIRRVQRGRDGIYVTSLARPSALDQFRGIRLNFGDEDPELITRWVVAARDRHCARPRVGATDV